VIVVTGASGVIGRALMARLQAERLPYVSLERKFLTCPEALAAGVSRRPSLIVHLAAVVPQPPTVPDDEINANRTRAIDEVVLKAVTLWDCHVLYASGCSLYTKTGSESRREDEAAGVEPTPVSAYLQAKLQGEQNFLASNRATVLRISAPIGPGLSNATVLGRFLAAAMSGRTLEVWGSGQREQNYVDVADLADALFRVMILRPRELINIAADQPLTMLELAQQTVQACGKGEIRLLGKPDPRDGEPARFSNRKAAEMLGWRPMTSMQVSLERLIQTL
jgi:nucleoside-diphosphate-sugar epimerase